MQLNLSFSSNMCLRTLCPSLFLVFLFLLAACNKNNYAYKTAYQFKSTTGAPDYTQLAYWAAHPWKTDLADSVPKPLLRNYNNDSAVDVFFIHPTTFTSKSDTAWNATIDDAKLNAKTDYSSILYQASAFNQNSRVFAPRYRQAHYRCFFTTAPEATAAFDLAYNDIKKAFTYYITHYNNGRPIIIAAHSQGTVHAGRLLREFFEGKPLQHQLVCAYLIGMPIPNTYFTTLPSCKDSLATGCFVGWRSFKKGYTDKEFVAKEQFKSIVVNPLNWTQDSLLVPSSFNIGGVLKNFNKVKPRVTNAQVHGNVLWVRKPRFFGNFLLTTKNYHIADINLFYSNIRQNMASRVRQYFLRSKNP